MRADLRKSWALPLISGFLIANASGTANSLDYSSIREENKNSIVHIHSERTKKNGTGVPEHRYGTGFIISENGHVLTASHVVNKEDNDTITETTGSVRSRHAQKFKLELITRDEGIDLALLVFPDVGTRWKPVRFGSSRSVPNDASLYALGFPANFDLTAVTGILSNKVGPKGVWQTTLPINRGHSGGPVFDMTGAVVAIASAGSDAYQQITFAIPESYSRGLRDLIAAVRVASSRIVSSDPGIFTPEKRQVAVSQRFTFYRSIDHDEESSPRELFCLPQAYKVAKITEGTITQSGPETRLLSVEVDPTKTNCVAVSAFIKGHGVVKYGPISVDHKGRGWLGLDLVVDGVAKE